MMTTGAMLVILLICAPDGRVEALAAGPADKEEVGAKPREGSDTAWEPCPYPPSATFVGIEFDVSTRRTEAPGSDIWPITWADDDHQYAAFGDGAGFGATNAQAQRGPTRVSLGVTRIEGDFDNYHGVNVWGGYRAENPAQFTGKGTGILCVGGVLYMMVAGPGSLCVPQTRVAVSYDHARTWRLSDWHWSMQDRLFAGTFLNFGKDYEGARDEYVYIYFTRIEDPPQEPRNWLHESPGRVDLARVPREQILTQEVYEWFAGLGEDGHPRWTRDLKARTHVFEDRNGIKVVSVSCPPALRRCLLLYNPHDNGGHFALFEAPQPWGPWRTVAYLRRYAPFIPPEENRRVSIFHFAPKWWHGNGLEFTLIFNTGDDAWNTMQGRLGSPTRNSALGAPLLLR